MFALLKARRRAAEEAPSGMVVHGKLEDQPVAKDPVWTRERFENFGRPVLGQYRPVVVAQLARRFLWPEIEIRLSQPLEARQLEETFEQLVDVDETPVLVFHERHGGAVVPSSMKTGFAFPPRPPLLGPLP